MLSPTSLTRSQQRPLRRACPEGGSVGITTFLGDHTTEAGSVYSPAACLGDASHTWSGMTSRRVPISSFGTAMVTTFIDNSQKLPISASLAPHPVCCYQNLRNTSRCHTPCGRLVQWASHPSVTGDARHFRLLVVTHQVLLPVIQTGRTMINKTQVRVEIVLASCKPTH